MVRPAAPTGSGSWGLFFVGAIMTPVCVYIDGFNLYHALAKFGDNQVKWLDLNALSQRLILPQSEKVQGVFSDGSYGISNKTDRCRCPSSHGSLERSDHRVPFEAKDQPGSGQSMLIA
jgi:hypothetical protein